MLPFLNWAMKQNIDPLPGVSVELSEMNIEKLNYLLPATTIFIVDVLS